MMTIRVLLIHGAWVSAALLPLAAAAQTAQVPEVNPQAAVPAVQYRSVFRDASLGVEQDKLDWRRVNNDVGQFTRGHVDILKQEALEAQPGTRPAPAATPPAPTRAPAAPTSTHQH